MRSELAVLIAALPLLPAAPAVAASTELQLRYETYAAGIPVADVDAGFGIGRWTYQLRLSYRTTGLVGFFYHGHQVNAVEGTWRADDAVPRRFVGEGVWHGEPRIVRIDYQNGKPVIRSLEPPNRDEREPVPVALQANSIDTLSAVADLIRRVADTGRCDTVVHTYDGRRATEIAARTVGEETLEPTSRSSFSGRALRCDFTGRMLAGFKLTDDRQADAKPLHGTAWLARVEPGAPPLPVRMSFETRWFGDATMYLQSVTAHPDVLAAH